jgi:predicted RNase H-like nuclease (RuvC/YqgF family)
MCIQQLCSQPFYPYTPASSLSDYSARLKRWWFAMTPGMLTALVGAVALLLGAFVNKAWDYVIANRTLIKSLEAKSDDREAAAKAQADAKEASNLEWLEKHTTGLRSEIVELKAEVVGLRADIKARDGIHDQEKVAWEAVCVGYRDQISALDAAAKQAAIDHNAEIKQMVADHQREINELTSMLHTVETAVEIHENVAREIRRGTGTGNGDRPVTVAAPNIDALALHQTTPAPEDEAKKP